MNDYRVDRIDEIYELVDTFCHTHEVKSDKCQRIIYRGQSNSEWELTPSIKRPNNAWKREYAILNDAIQNYPNNKFSNMSIFLKLAHLQHYGQPTKPQIGEISKLLTDPTKSEQIVIPAENKLSIMRALEEKNISREYLFPKEQKSGNK